MAGLSPCRYKKGHLVPQLGFRFDIKGEETLFEFRRCDEVGKEISSTNKGFGIVVCTVHYNSKFVSKPHEGKEIIIHCLRQYF